MGQVRDMLNRPFEVKVAEAQGLIARNLRTYGDKAAIGCSFGKDSLIVVHMAIAQMPDTPIVFCNTGVEHPQTLRFAKDLTAAWNLNLIEARPVKTFWQVVDEYGFAPGSKNTSAGKRCCYWLKEKQMLDQIRANGWQAVMDGTTAAENRQRTLRAVSHGACFHHKQWNVQKVRPLLYWTEDEVRDYIESQGIPNNPLYDKGLTRVGCMACTAYKTWEENMSRENPKLYRLIKLRKDQQYSLKL